MAKKQTKANGAKAAVVDAEEAPSVETLPESSTQYAVRLVGPGSDKRKLRLRAGGGLYVFERRGPAQTLTLTPTQAAELGAKGYDVTLAKPAKDKT